MSLFDTALAVEKIAPVFMLFMLLGENNDCKWLYFNVYFKKMLTDTIEIEVDTIGFAIAFYRFYS